MGFDRRIGGRRTWLSLSFIGDSYRFRSELCDCFTRVLVDDGELSRAREWRAFVVILYVLPKGLAHESRDDRRLLLFARLTVIELNCLTT